MGADIAFKFDQGRLRSFCRRHGITRLALFGSRLRGEYRPDSDVDILVEFRPDRTPGFSFARIEEELSELLGLEVDLNTSAMLSHYFRQ